MEENLEKQRTQDYLDGIKAGARGESIPPDASRQWQEGYEIGLKNTPKQ